MSTKIFSLFIAALIVVGQTEAYYLAYSAYGYPSVYGAPVVASPYAYAYAPAAYALWGSNKGKAMDGEKAPEQPPTSGLTNNRQ
ncbi:unnamed protein product, partial [Mesorhabditis belari]|uniref:Uncharacterized protein n=1 Tax=Mesorhabditis belari TaxID=2138241 RepID=A0AAF3FKV7_9BILA